MIVKTIESGPDVNVVVGLITEQDTYAEAYFTAKGLPAAAQDTCLANVMARPIRTSLQYFARVLAYRELLKQGNNVLNTAHISLSHTPGAVAIAWGSPERFEGVGVDIEHKKRCIGPELERYFIAPDDYQTGLDRLSIWCIKEAAFKCLDAFQRSLVLRDITIRPHSDGNFLCQTAERSCKVQLLDAEGDYFVAVAWR